MQQHALENRKKTNIRLSVRHHDNKRKVLIELLADGIYYKIGAAAEKALVLCLWCGHTPRSAPEHIVHVRSETRYEEQTVEL